MTPEQEFEAAPHADALKEFDAAPAVPDKPSRLSQLATAIKGIPRLDATDMLPLGRVASWATHPDRARASLMGVTSNAAPRILAGMEGVRGALTPGETFSGEYDKALPDYQKQYMKASQENPADNILGAVAQPNPLAKLKAASTAGKAGLAAARVGYSAANGGLSDWLGGGEHPGEAAAKTGAISAGLEAGAPLAGKLYNAAGGQFLKAAGYKTGIANPAKKLGVPMLNAAGEENLPQLGNDMADAGLIPFGASKAKVFQKSKALQDMAGNSQRAAIGVMDSAGPADANAAAGMAQGRVNALTDPAQGGTLQMARASGPADGLIQDIKDTGQIKPTFQALQDLKSDAYKSTGWQLHPENAPMLQQRAAGGIEQYLEQSADKSGVGGQLRSANKSYGIASKAAALSENAAQREAGFRPNWLAATAGIAGGAPHGATTSLGAGLGLMALDHVGKTRGNAMAGPALRAGSQVAQMGGKIASEAPAAAVSLEQWLSSPPKPDDEREQDGADHLSRNNP